MYFDFWDNRPDTPRLSSPLTPREKGMAAVVVHLLVIILALAWPELPFVKAAEAQRLKELEAQQIAQRENNPRFVFMEPKFEMKVTPPERAYRSDVDSRASAKERAVDRRTQCRSRAATRLKKSLRRQGPRERPTCGSTGWGANGEAARLEPAPRTAPTRTAERLLLRSEFAKPQMRGPSTGVLADAIRNLNKYAGKKCSTISGRCARPELPILPVRFKGCRVRPWLRAFAPKSVDWFFPYAQCDEGHVY